MTTDGSSPDCGPTPTSRAAFRQRVWGAFGLTLGGGAGIVFVGFTLPLAIEREARPYPGLLIVVTVLAVWWGLIVLPREARLLTRRGSRMEVVGVVGDVRRRWWLHPLRRVEEQAWLFVADTGVAIPVWPHDARRLQQPMDALIRGDLEVGRRVVIEFGDEVFFPIGRVVDAARLAHLAPASPELPVGQSTREPVTATWER